MDAKLERFLKQIELEDIYIEKLKEEMNMRSTPNGTIIDIVPEGTVISGTEFLQNRGIDWLKTTFNGKTGYVAVLPTSTNYAVEVFEEEQLPTTDFEKLYNEEKLKADSLSQKINAIKKILEQ